ncbi:MAG: hypothetical protein AVDCRST_MAG23-253 [uncultured Sphingosinicella sp.]|uniref:DUF2975 domain-containing protein n=1 Tax=uncultured Sphingosinicella sp. TaxID=478748 RepID=A0A6J4TGH1_9SPHN|nr:DUF2975 domain-containing protein [uncultured Sphingosinicella sp.]CAA9521940.1 MAG: hypothetical protein AVDCRST_MAG23-253 [uncultured Sphingosinicella sp.]
MTVSYPDALAASRTLLRTLVVLNLLLGVLILALLIAGLIAESAVMGALGVRRHDGSEAMILGMRLIMGIGIASVPLAHVVLTRLLAIVDTVRAGTPFVAGNGARLQTIAWALLGLELLHLAVGAVAAGASSKAQALDMDWNLSVAGWLAVVLLFVLARVFDEGARMREDLEGTV